MVLKKPYAFLIKNFRKIHLFLVALMIFSMISLYSVITFFKEYVANNYSVTVTDTLLTSTISPWVYLSIILTIVTLITIYILLKNKKKPTKMYFFTILYYVLLLVAIIVLTFLIKSLSNGLWSTASARTYRDFTNILYYPQIYFIIVMFLRALGFNVKQFNFKNDLKELEITDKDSEEIELNLNFQTYKYERKIRRFIREFKYYYLENKLVFLVIGIIALLAGGIFTYKNVEKVKYTYNENKTFTLNSFTYKVTGSMITNLDQKGNIINKDKYYVVVKFEVKNNGKNDAKINYDNFKLYYGSNYVYPSLNLGNSFLDFADPYMNDIVYAKDDTKTYLMAYEIDRKYQNRNFKLVMYQGVSTKSEKFLAKTISIKLNPIKYENTEVVRSTNLNEDISLASSLLKNSRIKIKSAEFTNRYEYNYESCYNETCRTYTDVVVADVSYQNKYALIVMDYELELDNTADSYVNVNDLKAFTTNFIEVEYTINGETTKTSVNYANPPRVKNKLILETDGSVINADSVNLLITIRNRCYTVKLK